MSVYGATYKEDGEMHLYFDTRDTVSCDFYLGEVTNGGCKSFLWWEISRQTWTKDSQHKVSFYRGSLQSLDQV